MFVVLSLATGIPAPAQTRPEGEKQTLTISGNVGMGGVMMQGVPGNPVTDKNGSYFAAVDYGWSGTVTPTKEGYTFEPASRAYTNLISNQTNDNYAPRIITYTISGKVGLPGAQMRGLPDNPFSDEAGFYKSTVMYGWSGVVRPVKEGYKFKPVEKNYQKVIADLKNQNYTAEQIMFTISDVIMVGGSPVPGVRVSASSGESSVTDTRGRFNIEVPYGWSGELKLEKKGLVFNPPTKSFTNVTTNIRDGRPEAPLEWSFGSQGWVPMRTGVTTSSSRRAGRSSGMSMAMASGAGRKVLVVPAAEVKAQDLAEITEDMQVMSLILDERFKETRRIQGVFTDFGDFFGRDNRQTEATYLQGYGVLFSMEVNFAFSPSPKPQGQQVGQTAEPVDSTWQRAKQQMFSPTDPRRSRGSGPPEEYNSRMVEELKRDLITTLKHAANIRGVQPDEWVILTVIGGGRQSGGGYGGAFMMGGMGGMYGGTSSGGMMGGYGVSSGSSGYSSGGMGGGMGGMMGGTGGRMGGIAGMSGPGGMDVSSATVLTIRAKKSDIDAFSNGQQDYEQFRQKVQIFTY